MSVMLINSVVDSVVNGAPEENFIDGRILVKGSIDTIGKDIPAAGVGLVDEGDGIIPFFVEDAEVVVAVVTLNNITVVTGFANDLLVIAADIDGLTFVDRRDFLDTDNGSFKVVEGVEEMEAHCCA
ncbi:hypothetical protein NDU88_006821 [Pleurodeles waltl]|uniref:Uncharacterized protein n=1 Tax=Pleurodeles waltl TaxID=8319 RepID=A0AAV7MDY1_PLEWA|nr:hypothetical protein NDU88_006821 [Pleurodeles waltl]